MGLVNFLTEKMPKMGGQLGKFNDILDVVRYPLIGISFILLGKADPNEKSYDLTMFSNDT